jgi:hypothetical protein
MTHERKSALINTTILATLIGFWLDGYHSLILVTAGLILFLVANIALGLSMPKTKTACKTKVQS